MNITKIICTKIFSVMSDVISLIKIGFIIGILYMTVGFVNLILLVIDFNIYFWYTL